MKTIDKHLFPMDIILKTPGEYDNAVFALYADKGMVVFESDKETRKASA